ncbi:hypothetical protein N8198_06155 [Gammaproteobacteria bacterium]|nr:hypothetical protein [Gammaproteobacteria bacterium]
MKWNKAGFVLVILTGCLYYSSASQADECEISTYREFDYESAIESMMTPCFELDKKNTTALAQEVNDTLNAAGGDDRSRALLALNVIQEHLRVTYIDRVTSQSKNAEALHEAIRILKQGIAENPEEPAKGLKDDWKLAKIARLPFALEQLNFEEPLLNAQECNISTGNCDNEFNLVADIVSSIFLVNAAIDEYTTNFRAEALHVRKRRRTSWDSYYDDLTFQYPWELWSNSLLLEATDNRALVDGNMIGFRELPESKLVLLHPEINLAYVDNAADEYEVTLTVEMLGYEAFDFDGSGKVKNPWGISLLAAYLDRTDRNESGWTGGLLFKYNGYSLGVTDNHGDTGIILNFNLSQRLFEVKQESRLYYDEYKGNIETVRKSLE